MGSGPRPRGRTLLNAATGETISLIALLAVLAWAVTRPRGWPEAVMAVPAALVTMATRAIPVSAAPLQPQADMSSSDDGPNRAKKTLFGAGG